MKQPKPRMAILDIETSHDILASFGLKEQYHSPENILADWYIICARWKWHGGSKIYGSCVLDDMKRFKKDCADDYVVVKDMYDLFSDVDVVIGHNVKTFDWRKFYARLMYYRMKPLPAPIFIDTLKESRKLIAPSSHSLKHLSRYYNLTPKMEPSRGMGLKILKGDIAATKECYKYCGGDIKTTEEFFDLIAPHLINSPLNHNLWRADGIDCCVSCGGEHLTASTGARTTRTGRYRRWQCQDCGKYMQAKKAFKTTNLR